MEDEKRLEVAQKVTDLEDTLWFVLEDVVALKQHIPYVASLTRLERAIRDVIKDLREAQESAEEEEEEE